MNPAATSAAVRAASAKASSTAGTMLAALRVVPDRDERLAVGRLDGGHDLLGGGGRETRDLGEPVAGPRAQPHEQHRADQGGADRGSHLAHGRVRTRRQPGALRRNLREDDVGELGCGEPNAHPVHEQRDGEDEAAHAGRQQQGHAQDAGDLEHHADLDHPDGARNGGRGCPRWVRPRRIRARGSGTRGPSRRLCNPARPAGTAGGRTGGRTRPARRWWRSGSRTGRTGSATA